MSAALAMASRTCGCGAQIPAHKPRCGTCEGDRNRERSDRLAAVIRQLKESAARPVDTEREKQLVKELYTLDHPAPDALIAWVRNARAALLSGGARTSKRVRR